MRGLTPGVKGVNVLKEKDIDVTKRELSDSIPGIHVGDMTFCKGILDSKRVAPEGLKQERVALILGFFNELGP